MQGLDCVEFDKTYGSIVTTRNYYTPYGDPRPSLICASQLKAPCPADRSCIPPDSEKSLRVGCLFQTCDNEYEISN